MFIDSHCHLQDDLLINKVDEIVNEANENNIKYMIVSGSDAVSNRKAIELAEQYDIVYATVGYHPNDVKEINESDYILLKEQATHDKVVAVGEIGLDYYWDDSYKDLQKDAFKRQVSIAQEINKPIVVHSRDAINDTYDILKETDAKSIGGVIHAYSSSAEMATKFIDINFLIGIGGTLTFKNNNKTKRVVSEIPLSYILLETDAPYLTPVPFRGKINEPKLIRYVVSEIANIKGINEQEVMNVTTENAIELFKF